MKNLTLNYFAFMAGFILELWIITRSIRAVLKILFGGLLVGLLVFLPNRHGHPYNLQNKIDFWPLGVIQGALIISLVVLRKYLLSALHEGASLLLAIVYCYWLMEADRGGGITSMQAGLLLVPTLPIFFSAFTYVELGAGLRITLSLISSAIAVGFGISFFKNVVELRSAEWLLAHGDQQLAAQVLFQHFLLGASMVYVCHQIMLFFHFLPSRQGFFNQAYFDNVNTVMEEHLARYSPEQLPIWLAGLTVILAGGFLALNYWAQLLPYRMAISLVLVTGSAALALASRMIYPPAPRIS